MRGGVVLFDIPMNASGATSLSAMASGMQQTSNQQQTVQQPIMQQQPVQQPMQQLTSGANTMPTKPRFTGKQGVPLKKGQKWNISDNGAPLTQLRVCLDWDLGPTPMDLDASVFMLGADGRVIGDDWFVYYYKLISPDNSVKHHGDNPDGGGIDDEVVDINLPIVDQRVAKIVFVVTINEALERGLNFSMVQSAVVRIVNPVTNTELARYPLSSYGPVTSMIVGEVYRHNGSWKFNPVGDGVTRDLEGLCVMYGVNVSD